MPPAASRRPRTVEEYNDACFVVRDRNGQALAYVYFEDEPGAFNTTAMSRTRSKGPQR
jgi:hypothetical protein